MVVYALAEQAGMGEGPLTGAQRRHLKRWHTGVWAGALGHDRYSLPPETSPGEHPHAERGARCAHDRVLRRGRQGINLAGDGATGGAR